MVRNGTGGSNTDTGNDKEGNLNDIVHSRGYDIVGNDKKTKVSDPKRCKKERVWGAKGKFDFHMRLCGKVIAGEIKNQDKGGSTLEKIAWLADEAFLMKDKWNVDEFIIVLCGKVLTREQSTCAYLIKRAAKFTSEDFKITVYLEEEFLTRFK